MYSQSRAFPNPPSFGKDSYESASSNTSSLYNIRVPSQGSQSENHEKKGSKLQIVFGRIDNKARKIVSNAPENIGNFQTSLVDIGRSIFHYVLNPLTIALIFLAVCASIYSSIGQCFLQASAGISDTRAYAIPYVAAAVQEHAIGGVNATAYNLMNFASVSLSSLSEAYTNAQTEICNAMNETSSVTGSANKLTSMMSKRSPTEHVGISDPYQWAANHCGFDELEKGNVTDSGLSAISSISRSLLNNITHMSNIRVPAVNVTGFNATDYIRLDSRVRNAGIAWIVLFSCFSVFFIGIYWFYDYVVTEYGTEEKVVEKVLQINKDHTNGVEYSRTHEILEHSAHFCGAIYRWMKKNFISGDINRLLYCAVILGLFGISNTTILCGIDLDKLKEQSSIDQTWFNAVQTAYTQYEDTFNNRTISFISTFIKALNENHLLVARELEELYEFTISTSAPFSNGVAINLINLPLVGNRMLPDRVLVPGGSIHSLSTILRIVQSLATGCWITFVVLFAIWIFCTVLYYFFSL